MPVLGILGPDPSYKNDNGSADPAAAAALGAFGAGIGTEHDALTAIASGRLLVPVVAVQQDSQSGKSSEMAMPTLIGLDGRRALPAFTCADSLRCWQVDARPLPVAARRVWQAAVSDSVSVVIDVAGPVPLAVEGARLQALARGEPAPLPHEDADVQQAVAAALAGELAVRGFRLGPGGADHDLLIVLALSADQSGGLAERVAAAVMARLGGRLRRGVAIALAP